MQLWLLPEFTEANIVILCPKSKRHERCQGLSIDIYSWPVFHLAETIGALSARSRLGLIKPPLPIPLFLPQGNGEIESDLWTRERCRDNLVIAPERQLHPRQETMWGSQDYVSILRCRPRRLHGAVFVWRWRNIPAIVKPPCRRLRKITNLTVLSPVTSPNFRIITTHVNSRRFARRVTENFSILYENFSINIAHDK